MRRAPRVLLALLLAWASHGIAGCGAGLTGGSIPPGSGLGRADGVVIRGDNAGIPLTGARIQFQPVASRQSGGFVLPGSGGSSDDPPSPPNFDDQTPTEPAPVVVPGTVNVSAGQGGRFTALEVRSGPNRVTVTPPSGSGLATIQYELDVPANGSVWIVSAPLPTGLTTAGWTGIHVQPESIDLQIGEMVQLAVQLIGAAPPAVVPSYLVTGSMGLVNERGQFTGIRAGRGTVRVVAGPYDQTLSAVVRDVH